MQLDAVDGYGGERPGRELAGDGALGNERETAVEHPALERLGAGERERGLQLDADGGERGGHDRAGTGSLLAGKKRLRAKRASRDRGPARPRMICGDDGDDLIVGDHELGQAADAFGRTLDEPELA